MRILKTAFLCTLSLSLLTVEAISTAQADKYADQKPAREIEAEDARKAAEELARERAEIRKDVALSCDQIADEVVRLDRVIRNARETQISSSQAGTGVSVARTVGSLLIGSLGGVVGIVAVGALAGEAAESSGEKAAMIEENAEERQNRLAGVFDGKGCEGTLALTGEPEHDPVAQATRTEPASGTTARPVNKPRYNE